MWLKKITNVAFNDETTYSENSNKMLSYRRETALQGAL